MVSTNVISHVLIAKYEIIILISACSNNYSTQEESETKF